MPPLLYLVRINANSFLQHKLHLLRHLGDVRLAVYIVQQIRERRTSLSDNVHVAVMNEHSVLACLRAGPQRQVIGSFYQEKFPVRIHYSGDQSVEDFGEPEYQEHRQPLVAYVLVEAQTRVNVGQSVIV